MASALLATLAVSPASAAWHQASSPHFVIYSEEDPAELKAFATRLERFDAAVRLVRGMKDPPVGDGNRLTVFVARSVSEVQKLHRGVDRRMAGFFIPRGSGSVAFVPRSAGTKHDIDPEVVFQHEYAHHLMFSDLATPYPTWLVEGFAEFYSTANIGPDGTIGFGEAPVQRKAALRARRQPLPLESLLAGEDIHTGRERSALYARGWLLTHYLTFAPDRRGQIETYLGEMAKGSSSLDAAKAAFGDLGKLDRDLDDYLADEQFPYLTLPNDKVKSAEVQVERLGPGAEAAMPAYMRLQARTDEGVSKLAAEARTLAASHPDDALVTLTLAEAEWVARDYTASEAAAEKAMALAPQNSEAFIWKGRAHLARAEARQAGASFAEARSWFSKANKLDPENPEPLFYFYRAYRSEGIPPTANAIAALHYAAALAPQDMNYRLQSAREHLRANEPDKAKRMLVPVAYNPHGGRAAETAQNMLRLIDARNSAAAQGLVKEDDGAP